MRDAFHRELESLDQAIVQMGALVEQSTQMATTALRGGGRWTWPGPCGMEMRP